MIFALTIFILAYIAIASEKFPRHWVALLGGHLAVFFGVLTPSEALAYISWETLGLVAGMFIVVSVLVQAGFFTWLAMTSLRKVNYHPVPLVYYPDLVGNFSGNVYGEHHGHVVSCRFNFAALPFVGNSLRSLLLLQKFAPLTQAEPAPLLVILPMLFWGQRWVSTFPTLPSIRVHSQLPPPFYCWDIFTGPTARL